MPSPFPDFSSFAGGGGGGTSAAPSGGARTAYGTVPGPIGVPPNIFTQISGAVPGYSGLTSGTSNLISNEQQGVVSPQTLNALKTGAAQFGVANGMPGSGLESNQLFGNIAGFSENLQNEGIQNYLKLTGALAPTMTNPNLSAEISARNADLAAAPDPAKAAAQQLATWRDMFNLTRSAGSSPTGPWWAPGGVSTPPIGATVGRSYAGGLPGGSPSVFGSPDAFGYNYNNSEAGTTATLGAINPTERYVPPQWLNPYGGDQTYGGYSNPEYGSDVSQYYQSTGGED